VTPITPPSFRPAARRPANSLLDSSAMEAFGVVPRPWQAALADILDELLGPLR
jgi:dTDP-4-dehydrorhamnose reductase